MRWWIAIIAVALIANVALGQSPGPMPHNASNGLIFGNGVIFTGPLKPLPNQAICNVNGSLQGCAGSGGAGTVCIGPNVTLVNGVGLFTASCISTITTHLCLGRDLNTFSNAVTFPLPPNNGSITVNGVGSDVVTVVCL